MIKDRFFDRTNYLQILQKRVSALKDGYRQNIAIVGEENVGKTSAVFKFLDKFYDNRIIAIYLEVRPSSLEVFCKRFLGVLFYNFLQNSGLDLKEDLAYLMGKSCRYIPRTVEKANEILNALNKRKKVNIFSELFGLSEIIHQESGKYVVLILDEFHNLENIGLNNIYKEWSKLLITQKNTLYIIISSMIFKTRLILSKQLSLLFGNFEVVDITPFDTHTSGRYLEERLRSVRLSSGLRDFIINFTGGYPLYLELISDALLQSPETSLADILEGLLFDTSGILNQRFSNYIKRFMDTQNSRDYLSILYLISSGRNRIKDITHILHKQKKELSLRIYYLLELDAVSRSGDFLKVNDRLFAYWLKFVYQERLQSLTIDARNQKERFRGNLEGMILEFIKESEKPLFNRVHELLEHFGGDLVQLERKKFRLNHFREIKPLRFNNRILKDGLLGRSNEALWIMAIKNSPLTEQDVGEFVAECKRYHHKSQRKIIVTLKEVDVNTRLRALEEKIWTWDLNQLNQILDLFSMPRVIA